MKNKATALHHVRDASRSGLRNLAAQRSASPILTCLAVSLVSLAVGRTAWCDNGDGESAATAEPVSQEYIYLELLRTSVYETRGDLQQVEQRLGPLEAELRSLAKRIAEIERISSRKRERQTGPRKVKFRPPLAHIVNKPKSLILVCEEGRITPVDITLDLAEFENADEFGAAARTVVETGAEQEVRMVGRLGAFDVRVRLKKMQDVAQQAGHWLVRKDGHLGESVEAINAAESKIGNRLRTADPETTRIAFAVYPDSFEAFRQLRTLVWERGFDVNWIPMESGTPIRLGGGPGIAN